MTKQTPFDSHFIVESCTSKPFPTNKNDLGPNSFQTKMISDQQITISDQQITISDQQTTISDRCLTKVRPKFDQCLLKI
jgi:hypothetical protein